MSGEVGDVRFRWTMTVRRRYATTSIDVEAAGRIWSAWSVSSDGVALLSKDRILELPTGRVPADVVDALRCVAETQRLPRSPVVMAWLAETLHAKAPVLFMRGDGKVIDLHVVERQLLDIADMN